MEICCQLNSKQVVMFPARRSMQKTYKMNFISFTASTLEARRGSSSTNFYEILSLDSEKVGFDEIKKAYRSLALQYHPDVVSSSTKEESTKKFVELQTAYETLSNPVSRQKYDYELSCLSKFGVAGMGAQDWRTEFCKDVWEDQLSGLAFRSNNRKGREKRAYM
ncbi:chaperone protein dnaJ 20, chloroplastic-like [Thalictrum thalictroides]|uniref:Chaperone protein dnaJ 20, chloroplastic-like n=1 Tax=Thalictrum thalictroides TaxID=46969 RepID=A0A7J6X351_THATH|nr:chaperone protein dnaJ 20, chloroplastic-like [Thalictrum thalictroides]